MLVAPVQRRVNGAEVYRAAILTISHVVVLPPPAEREVIRPLPYPGVEGAQQVVDQSHQPGCHPTEGPCHKLFIQRAWRPPTLVSHIRPGENH